MKHKSRIIALILSAVLIMQTLAPAVFAVEAEGAKEPQNIGEETQQEPQAPTVEKTEKEQKDTQQESENGIKEQTKEPKSQEDAQAEPKPNEEKEEKTEAPKVEKEAKTKKEHKTEEILNEEEKIGVSKADTLIDGSNIDEKEEVKPLEYTITVTGGTANVSKAKKGEEITLIADKIDGKVFDGWQVVPETVEIVDNKFIMPESDVTVEAIYNEMVSMMANDTIKDITETGLDFSTLNLTEETTFKAGDGTVIYTPAKDGANAKVTLNNATIKRHQEYYCIKLLDNTSTDVIVNGDNNITLTFEGDYVNSPYTFVTYGEKGQINFKGNGTLNLSDQIMSAEIINVEDCTIIEKAYGESRITSKNKKAKIINYIINNKTIKLKGNISLDSKILVTGYNTLEVIENSVIDVNTNISGISKITNNGVLNFPKGTNLADKEIYGYGKEYINGEPCQRDITKTGLDYSEKIPTEEVTYTAGKGTVKFTPATTNTPATFTLTNATIGYVPYEVPNPRGWTDTKSLQYAFILHNGLDVKFIFNGNNVIQSRNFILQYGKNVKYTFCGTGTVDLKVNYILNDDLRPNITICDSVTISMTEGVEKGQFPLHRSLCVNDFTICDNAKLIKYDESITAIDATGNVYILGNASLDIKTQSNSTYDYDYKVIGADNFVLDTKGKVNINTDLVNGDYNFIKANQFTIKNGDLNFKLTNCSSKVCALSAPNITMDGGNIHFDENNSNCMNFNALDYKKICINGGSITGYASLSMITGDLGKNYVINPKAHVLLSDKNELYLYTDFDAKDLVKPENINTLNVYANLNVTEESVDKINAFTNIYNEGTINISGSDVSKLTITAQIYNNNKIDFSSKELYESNNTNIHNFSKMDSDGKIIAGGVMCVKGMPQGGNVTTSGLSLSITYSNSDDCIPYPFTKMEYEAGKGTITYIPETKDTLAKLVLDNATINVDNKKAIDLGSGKEFEIELVGINKISCKNYLHPMISSVQSIIFKGNGSLEITSDKTDIYTGNKITVNSGLIKSNKNIITESLLVDGENAQLITNGDIKNYQDALVTPEVTKGILMTKGDAIVNGTANLQENIVIENGKTLTIGDSAVLNIPDGKNITVNLGGKIINGGKVNGSIINNGNMYNKENGVANKVTGTGSTYFVVLNEPKGTTITYTEGTTFTDTTLEGATLVKKGTDLKFTVKATNESDIISDVSYQIGSNKKISLKPNKDNSYTVKGNLFTGKATLGAVAVSEANVITAPPQGRADLSYTGKPQDLVTAGTVVDGFKMQYKLQDTAEWSDTLPTGTNAGDYTVTYRAYNEIYKKEVAGNAPITVSIAKKKIEKPSEKTAVTYNGAEQTYAENTLEYTFTNATQTNANEIGYDVTVALSDKTNTEWADSTQTDLTHKFKINKLEVVFEWSDTEFNYDGNAHKPTATVKNMCGNDVVGIVVTGEQTDVGASYKATASELSGAAKDNYKLPSAKTTTFSINKVDAIVTLPTSKTGLTYTGVAQDLLTAGTSEHGTFKYCKTNSQTESDWTEAVPTETNANKSYSVWYKFVGDKNHNDIVPAEITGIKIAKANATVTADESTLSREYNGSNTQTIKYNLTGENNETGVLTFTDFAIGGKDVDTYPVKPKATSNELSSQNGMLFDNYEIYVPEANVTVTAKPIDIVVNGSNSFDYGSELVFTLTATLVNNENINDVAEIKYTTQADKNTELPSAPKNSGAYTAKAVLKSGVKNYSIKSGSKDFEITKAPYENKTASGSTKFGSTGTVDISGILCAGANIGNLSVTDEAKVLTENSVKLVDKTIEYAFVNNAENIGKAVTITIPVTSANYADYTITVTLTVLDKYDANVSATVANPEVTYGTEYNPTTWFKADKTDGENGQWTFTYAENTEKPTDVGDYEVIATYEDSNNKGTAKATLKINKANATSTIQSASQLITKQYDGNNDFSKNIVYDITGVNGETATYTVVGGTFAQANVGENIKITPNQEGSYKSSNGFEEGNYNITFADVFGSITKKPITVTATIADQTYSGSKLSPKATVGGDSLLTKSDYTVTYGVTAGDNVNVGKGHATVSPSQSSNFSFEPLAVTFNIEPLEAVIEFAPSSFTYNGKAHKPTASVKNLKGNDKCEVTVTGEQTNAGNHTATATALSNNNYKLLTTNATGNFEIKPKLLTWDLSGLTASKRFDGNTNAKLQGEIAVNGVIDKDSVVLQQTNLRIDNFPNKAVGKYELQLNGEVRIDNNNYVLPESLPKISAEIKKVAELPSSPEVQNKHEGTDYKLQQEEGITEVPDDLASKHELNTPAKIETKMEEAITEAMPEIPKENKKVLDVELMISTNNGGTWEKATKENFPKEGITITLPYPNGTNRHSHDFVVIHMITSGVKAGTTEQPKVTKTENGIKFTVMSLSPISIGWKEAPAPTPVVPTPVVPSKPSQGGGSYRGTSHSVGISTPALKQNVVVGGKVMQKSVGSEAAVSVYELQSSLKANQAKGNNLPLHADTVANGKIEARIYIDKNDLAQMKNPVKLGIDINQNAKENSRIKSLFNKFFANKTVVINFAQDGKFEIKLDVAIKAKDLFNEFSGNTLYLYSYNPKTNTYKLMHTKKNVLDNAGYFYFETNDGNSLVITDKPLKAK